ncbi:MAG: hypothetical protein WBA53_14425 [Burkholderiaceae bacterium]
MLANAFRYSERRSMAGIRWYSTELDLSTRERGAIELPGALAVVDQYVDDVKPRYTGGEQALAETMFGFCRSDADFIEICVHASDQITLRAELPPGKGLVARLRGATRTERTLDSTDSLKRCVTAYFSMSGEEFGAYLAAGPLR